jgi:hypothetical protein
LISSLLAAVAVEPEMQALVAAVVQRSLELQ